MIKTLVLFFTILISQNSSANSDYETFCLKRDNPSDKIVCNLSDKLKISPTKVGVGMMLASLEMTGTFCDFDFSDNFLDYRIQQENDIEVRKVVEFLIAFYSNKSPPGFNGDKKVFCKLQYSTYQKQIFK